MAKVEEDIYERAARTGLYTPEFLETLRRAGIHPATNPGSWRPRPVKQRPAWLAFVLRTLHLTERD